MIGIRNRRNLPRASPHTHASSNGGGDSFAGCEGVVDLSREYLATTLSQRVMVRGARFAKKLAGRQRFSWAVK
jgi:hypothetical protein